MIQLMSRKETARIGRGNYNNLSQSLEYTSQRVTLSRGRL